MIQRRSARWISAVGCTAVLVLWVIAVAPIFAQPRSPEPAVEAGKRITRRTMQSDGSVRIEYADGTVRVLPRAVEGPTAASGAASDPVPDGSGPRGKAQLPIPAAPHPMSSDAKMLEKYSEAVTQYYEYQVSGFKHRQSVFQWQLLSSRIIFAVVLVVVFSGLIFAALQFYLGARARVTTAPTPVTEFEASLKGIKVSSPVLGVIVLAISLGFFYLYLVYVYPIAEIF